MLFTITSCLFFLSDSQTLATCKIGIEITVRNYELPVATATGVTLEPLHVYYSMFRHV